MSSEARGCMAIAWEERLILARLPERPERSLLIAGREYLPATNNRSLAFHDWLRDAQGRLCGVRFTVVTVPPGLLPWLRSRQGVNEIGEGVLDIPLPADARAPFTTEEEQLIAHEPYVDHEGRFALLLDLLAVDERDLAHLGLAKPQPEQS